MSSTNALLSQLNLACLKDRYRLRRKLTQLQKISEDNPNYQALLSKIEDELNASIKLATCRQQAAVQIDYPDLPVSNRRQEILKTIQQHQVTILCGETGSGKTTQLPKMCLELGLGVFGKIGHTQPRRLAARAVATRVAQELYSELGQIVSFKVRFNETGDERSRIKVMTDGILLAEIQSDPFLNQYDCLIIDEAHERSLNIDFLLGYLKQLLPKRPDLKLIITSATIDPERFSKHFDDAPILLVEGRTYPVEVHYLDPAEKNLSQNQAISEAITQLRRQGRGDILVFLPTERDIREAAKFLARADLSDEIIPLYSRLSNNEQQKIFKHSNGRRIILSTNVAETSLTVPGIRYVVDTGTARISRYNARSKVQRLPIEAISQASANQRKGRCGRVEAGRCIRLYAETDFLSRPEFTDPEIKRTNLASVILQMEALRLGHIDDFPFIEPPSPNQVRSGYRLLYEIGAVNENQQPTRLGKLVSRLPLDPQLGRILIMAHQLGCLREALIIVSFLSIQDPRERPLEKQAQADSKHARFIDEKSDFIALINLWDWYRHEEKELSQNKLRKLCIEDFLSFTRMREWKDIHLQLQLQLKALKITCKNPSPITFKLGGKAANEGRKLPYDSLHQTLLSGLVSHIGLRNTLDHKTKKQINKRASNKGKRKPMQPYTGPRELQFYLFPGSPMSKKTPKWVLSSELVETTALFARNIAQINPIWIEQTSPHLIQREYFDVHFQLEHGHIAAKEKVSIFGLILSSGRLVNYGPINPSIAREVFIREGLVEGSLQTNLPFFLHNQKLINDVRLLEAKSRRPDLLVDEETLFLFYDKALPNGIYNILLLKKWLKTQAQHALFFDKKELLARETNHVNPKQFPAHLAYEQFNLPLHYAHAPGQTHDGLNLHIPLAALGQIHPARGQWLVPGLLEEKVTELIRALPKAQRKNFVPAPDFAKAAINSIICESDSDNLLNKLSHALLRMTGIEVLPKDWRESDIPLHLQLRYCVVDEENNIIECSRNLDTLKDKLSVQAQTALTHSPKSDSQTTEKTTYTQWNFGDLDFEKNISHMDIALKSYAALVPDSGGVIIKHFDTPAKAQHAHQNGLRFLFKSALQPWIKQFNWREIDKTCLLYSRVKHTHPHLSKGSNNHCKQFKIDLTNAMINRLCLHDSPHLLTQTEFESRVKAVQGDVNVTLSEIHRELHTSLTLFFELQKELTNTPLPLLETAKDIKTQIEDLIYIGFAAQTSEAMLVRLPTYLHAAKIRLAKAQNDVSRDRRGYIEMQDLHKKINALEIKIHGTPEQAQLNQMLQELRISLFAQPIKTAYPISSKRITQFIAEIGEQFA